MSDLWKKVECILLTLKNEGVFLQAAQSNVRATSKAELCHLFDASRLYRGEQQKMHRSNLTTYFSKPEKRPPYFLTELTEVVGLTELGFDVSIWSKDIAQLPELIRVALAGGVLDKLLNKETNSNLIEIGTVNPMGLMLNDPNPAVLRVFEYPEVAIPAGEMVLSRLSMPFNGFVRIFASERGEFFPISNNLGLDSNSVHQGDYSLEGLTTSAEVARTIIMAFACKMDVFETWPVEYNPSQKMTHGAFLALISKFFEIDCEERKSSVCSFVTAVGS